MNWLEIRRNRYQPKETLPGISWPKGFKTQGVTSGIKPSGKPDLALILSESDAAAAGVFTQNAFPGAPVTITKKHIANGTARAIVCNSGNSNVCNGEQGLRDALSMCESVANLAEIQTEDVLVASTGVIGMPMPMSNIQAGIATLFQAGLGSEQIHDRHAADAILTTDLVAKWESKAIEIDGKVVRLAGIAKGSGMIAPNMATMLSFITTDANMGTELLNEALHEAVGQSFNCISVDSDTSTSDMVLILANSASGHPEIKDMGGDDYRHFVRALTDVCRSLAYQVIQDGEGAEHVIKVIVKGAKSRHDADLVGKAVINSPLVKTAVHGGDPNWGRLIMAIGNSGAEIDSTQLSIMLGVHQIVKMGKGAHGLNKINRDLEATMSSFEVPITIDLGFGHLGFEQNVIWLGCDLSREYIHINADYTT